MWIIVQDRPQLSSVRVVLDRRAVVIGVPVIPACHIDVAKAVDGNRVADVTEQAIARSTVAGNPLLVPVGVVLDRDAIVPIPIADAAVPSDIRVAGGVDSQVMRVV